MITSMEVVRLTGISRDRINYAEEIGALPQAQRVANAKVYDDAAVKRILQYFEGRKKWSRKDKNDNTSIA